MEFNGALVKTADKTIGIAVVSDHFLQLSAQERVQLMKQYGTAFPQTPFVLLLQNEEGESKFFGRPDLIALLAEIPLTYITWKTFVTKEE